MKQLAFYRVAVLAVAVSLAAGAAAQRFDKRIAPGISLHQRITANPPLAVHWVTVDPKAGPQLRVELGHDRVVTEETGRGRETVSGTAWRHRAAVALNGDFFSFDSGDPLGMCVRGAELLSEPQRDRVVVGWTDRGTVVMGNPGWSGQVTAATGFTFALGGLNRRPAENELVLITRAFGPRIKLADSFDYVVIPTLSRAPAVNHIIDGRISDAGFDATEVGIPTGGAVLIGRGEAGQFLRLYGTKGSRFRFNLRVTGPVDWSRVVDAMGGGSWLVRDGKVNVTAEREGFGGSFSNARHPRSAVGVMRDGRVLLVAVDGRQKHSRGMSLDELAKFMLDIGAVNAVNLDGGGSTALVVRGAVVNCPSDPAERMVANSIVVASTAPTGFDGDDYVFNQPEVRLAPDGRMRLQVIGERNGKPIDTANIVRGSAVGAAFVNQAGELVALRPGVGSFSAWVQGVLVRGDVVVEAPATTPPTETAPPTEPASPTEQAPTEE